MENDALFGKVSAIICDILGKHCSKSIEFEREVSMFGMISVSVDKSSQREPREYLLKIDHTVTKPIASTSASASAASIPCSSNSSLFSAPNRLELPAASEIFSKPNFSSGNSGNNNNNNNSSNNNAHLAAAAAAAAALADGGSLASRIMALEMLASLDGRPSPCVEPFLNSLGGSLDAISDQRFSLPLPMPMPMPMQFPMPMPMPMPLPLQMAQNSTLPPFSMPPNSLYGDLSNHLNEDRSNEISAAAARMKVITDLKQDRRTLRQDPQTAEVFSWIRSMADTSDTACQICGKHFTNKWSLRRHLLQHTGYKPYLCVLCNRSFYRRDHFSSHMVAWHKNDPNRSAATKKALLRHQRENEQEQSSASDLDKTLLGSEDVQQSPLFEQMNTIDVDVDVDVDVDADADADADADGGNRDGERDGDVDIEAKLCEIGENGNENENENEEGGAVHEEEGRNYGRRLGDFAPEHAARNRRSYSDQRANADAPNEREEKNNQLGVCDRNLEMRSFHAPLLLTGAPCQKPVERDSPTVAANESNTNNNKSTAYTLTHTRTTPHENNNDCAHSQAQTQTQTHSHTGRAELSDRTTCVCSAGAKKRRYDERYEFEYGCAAECDEKPIDVVTVADADYNEPNANVPAERPVTLDNAFSEAKTEDAVTDNYAMSGDVCADSVSVDRLTGRAQVDQSDCSVCISNEATTGRTTVANAPLMPTGLIAAPNPNQNPNAIPIPLRTRITTSPQAPSLHKNTTSTTRTTVDGCRC